MGEDRQLNLTQVAVGSVGAADVKVQVHAAGICGTDLHILHGTYPSNPPVILGHEFAGRIIEAGAAVTNVQVGDFVSVEPHLYCFQCRPCLDGKEHLCVKRRGFGVHMNGGFAELTVVPARNAYRLPDGVSVADGALAEPLGCCLHGVDRADIQLGDNVVIFGAGPIGLILTALVLRAGAATVLVIEPNKARRKASLMYGATQIADPSEAASAVADLTDGYGADVTFEATGSPKALESAIDATGPGGKVVVFGVSDPSSRISVSPNRVYNEELTIMGSLINPYTHRRALNILKTLELPSLVSHSFPLESFAEAFEVARSGEGLKVQITPQG